MGFSEDRASGKFGPRYLLTAENPYVLWDATEDWKRRWQARGQMPLDVFRAPRIDFDRLLDVGSTISMFGEERLLIIHDAGKVPQPQQERMISVLKRFSDSTKILLTAMEFDKRRKYYKFVSEWAVLEEFPKIYENQIPGWVVRIADDFGWTISQAAAQFLGECCGEDLFEARQTIERITLQVGRPRRIEVSDVETALSGTGSHSVFLLLEAVTKPDLRRALEIVRSLFAGDEYPEMWLGALGTLLQRMLAINELGHASPAEIMQKTGVKPKMAEVARRQAAYFKAQGIVAAIYACFETDWAIKTSRVTPLMGWELLVYRLCNRQTLLDKPLFTLESSI
jgi:DNA polymerase-3 subunit delta